MASRSDIEEGAANPGLLIIDQDIVFDCASCLGELVVNRAGIGLECLCGHCGQPLTIPERSKAPLVRPVSLNFAPVAPASAPPVEHPFDFSGLSPEQLARRSEDLKHQLKENMSQDVEMRGHVNRATIELHRLQMRHKKLQSRQAEIEAEIMAARDWTQKRTRAATE